MSQPLLQDIANAVGVSVSTVSRALAGRPVRESTRARVVKAAREMGYADTPGVAPAQSPREEGMHSFKRIGVAVNKLSAFFEFSTMTSILETLQRVGHAMDLVDIEANSPAEELIERLSERCDGLLLFSTTLDDDAICRICDPETTVLVNRRVEGYSSVALDEDSGMLLALRHLASLGHRRIAYTSMAGTYWSNDKKTDSIERIAKELDMEPVILHGFETTYNSGLNAADALLVEDGITAVLAHDEMLASGLVSRLLERGLRVPEDVSIISMSDGQIALITRPQLSAVDARQPQVSRLAINMLLSHLMAHDAGKQVEPEVVSVTESFSIRASTGIPRKIS